MRECSAAWGHRHHKLAFPSVRHPRSTVGRRAWPRAASAWGGEGPSSSDSREPRPRPQAGAPEPGALGWCAASGAGENVRELDRPDTHQIPQCDGEPAPQPPLARASCAGGRKPPLGYTQNDSIIEAGTHTRPVTRPVVRPPKLARQGRQTKSCSLCHVTGALHPARLCDS